MPPRKKTAHQSPAQIQASKRNFSHLRAKGALAAILYLRGEYGFWAAGGCALIHAEEELKNFINQQFPTK